VSVRLGNGDGTFQAPINYGSGGVQALSVAITDLNGDGKPDLVVVNSCPGDGSGSCSAGPGQIGVLPGNGDGTFQPAISYFSGGGLPNAVGIGDVNGDGHPDLVVDNSCQPVERGGCSSPGSVGVLLGNGDSTFRPAVTYPAGTQSNISLAVGDLNRDGYLDVVVIGGIDVGEVMVLLGNGDGTFQPQTIYRWEGYYPESVAIADVNGDGYPDLAVANYCQDPQRVCTTGSVNISFGNGGGTFQAPVSYSSGGFDARSVAVGDVNGDSRPDLIVASIYLNVPNGLAPGEVNVLLGNGDGTFQAAVNFLSGGAAPQSIVIADLNGDEKPDLVANNPCEEMRCVETQGIQAIQGTVGMLLNNAGLAQSTTTTTVASSLNPSSFGKVVTFSATVRSESSIPTGTVKFYSETAILGTAPLVNGHASIPVSTLVAGTHQISAVYQGSAKFRFSGSTPLKQDVKYASATTFTSLLSSPNPSVFGQAVTFTATVTSPGGTPPDGEIVTFYEGANVIGRAFLVAGIASLTQFRGAPARISTMTALYPGDINFASSISSGLLQVINSNTQFKTATTLTSSLNPSIYGQKVTLTATVKTAGSVIPTGNVAYWWSQSGRTLVIGTAALNAGGVATLIKSNLNADPYELLAVYRGDVNNGASASARLYQVVKQTTSSATLTSSLNPSIKGQAVTFTARIISPTVTATGPVTFSVGNSVLGTAQLSGGIARFTISTLPVGLTKVQVTYLGNSDIAKSSASLLQKTQAGKSGPSGAVNHSTVRRETYHLSPSAATYLP
jgi:hypothetical protein